MRHLLFFLLLSSVAAAQQHDSIDSRLSVKLSPLSLPGVYVGPCARISLEHKLRSSWAAQYDAGVFFYSTKGMTFRAELKRYLNNAGRTSGKYLSAELQYKYQRYTTPAVSEHDTIDGDVFDLDPFDVSKNVECLTFKFGNIKVWRSGFILEVFCGLGIRFQQVQNSLSAYDNEHMPSTSDYGPNIILDQAGNHVYPNLVAGVKVGYSFR